MDTGSSTFIELNYTLCATPHFFWTWLYHMHVNYVTSVILSLLSKSTPWFSISGVPTATSLVYNETTRSLTCTSTGGPPTTVTWRRNGAVITINATYQQTQVVTDPVTGTYQTVLTIDQSVTDIFGTYSCTVGNTWGISAAINTTGICKHCDIIGRLVFTTALATFVVSGKLPTTDQ